MTNATNDQKPFVDDTKKKVCSEEAGGRDSRLG